MQPIKSVLPFCSALPIQYTPGRGLIGGHGSASVGQEASTAKKK